MEQAPLAGPALASLLTGLATLLKLSFEFRDYDVDQTRGQWIGHLPFQEPIAQNLSFQLSELAVCHRGLPSGEPTLPPRIFS